MILYEFIQLLILILPLGIYTTFCLFVCVVFTIKHVKQETVFKRILFCYCFAAAVASFLLLAYFYWVDLFKQFDVLYGTSVIFAMILFHQMLCFAIRSNKAFGFWHYALAGLVCACMLVCKMLLPEIWAEEGIQAMLIVSLLFGIIHAALPLLSVFRHQVQLAAAHHTTETIDKTRAIPFIVEIVLFPWVFALCPLIMGQKLEILPSLVLMASILMSLRMTIPLTYGIIRHYTTSFNEASLLAAHIDEPDVAIEKPVAPKRKPKKKKKKTKKISTPKASSKKDAVGGNLSIEAAEEHSEIKNEGIEKPVYRKSGEGNRRNRRLIELEKKSFKQYFQKEMPYLNPRLTMHDLAESLESSRTNISEFINQSFGMNFNAYINQWRLKEMKHLLSLPENEGKTTAELVKQAGFTDHRNYLRAKKMQEERKKKVRAKNNLSK